MEQIQDNGTIIILGVTGIIFAILWLGRKELILKLITRLCVTAVLTYSVNTIMIYYKLPYMVGINGWTLAIMGLLGIPGVCALYTICFFL